MRGRVLVVEAAVSIDQNICKPLNWGLGNLGLA